MDTRLLKKLRRIAKRQVKLIMVGDIYFVMNKIGRKYYPRSFQTIGEARKEWRSAIYNKVAVEVMIRRINQIYIEKEK